MAWKRIQVSGTISTTPPTGASATQVQGTVANTNPAANNPVWVAGYDGSNVQGLKTETSGILRVALYNSAGTAFSLSSGSSDASSVSLNTLATTSYKMLYDAAANNWERERAVTTFATVVATASGDTAVFTPTTGKKFRLMAYSIEITENAAQSVAGLIEIIFRDSTTAMPFGCSIFVPGAAGTTFSSPYDTGWRVLQQGFLSAVANNVLNINLSAALTAGEVRVNVALSEE